MSMADSPVKSCIYARRSIRKFATQPVERSLIEELLQAGCMAPTGSNIQSWRFVVLDEPKRIEAVCAVSPGISGRPPHILVLCADEDLAFARAVAGAGSLAAGIYAWPHRTSCCWRQTWGWEPV